MGNMLNILNATWERCNWLYCDHQQSCNIFEAACMRLASVFCFFHSLIIICGHHCCVAMSLCINSLGCDCAQSKKHALMHTPNDRYVGRDGTESDKAGKNKMCCCFFFLLSPSPPMHRPTRPICSKMAKAGADLPGDFCNVLLVSKV